MNRSQFTGLQRQLRAPESLIGDLSDLERYHHDATSYRAVPTALLLAETAQDVATAVKFCAAEDIPITPRGAGTGLSGGCVVSPGGLLLSTEKLRHMEIVPDRRLALCGPGVITKELQDAAQEFGLTYPPDPASYEESTLGGNVAENAGGLRCKRFGVTKDYVLGLEAVLPDGQVLRTGLFDQNRGFSLGELLIGSEGTLAIITNIALRLIDLPERGETILVAFDNPKDAAQAVADINTSGIVPTVMEFLDGDAAACSNDCEKAEGFDTVAAILLLETSDIDAPAQTAQIKRICEKSNCSNLRTETDPERAENLWRVRRNISKAIKAMAGLRISEDVAVPNSQFPALVQFVSGMNQQSRLRINCFGHAGDGNLHVNFLAPIDSERERAEVEKWVDVLMRRTVALGGTLTGEHGIGLAKRQYLGLEFSPATLGAMSAIKDVFDPARLFNPDKLLTP
ncbi:MAG: FAD-binding protein [candidate division Zixibacteria bacterium]|nr:FAD-binding protein [candidate division Zixibacteria bacterium]